jgi:hypothetical protein
MLQTFRVRPLDSNIAVEARSTRVDRFGNALSVRVSDGEGAPCRHCLREVPEGKGLILIGHSPFTRLGPFREVGPIFICSEACARYAARERLPEVVRSRLVQLRAYSVEEEILYDHSTLLPGTEVEAALPPVFQDPRVAFAHLRSGLNGCFLCQVEACEG